MGYDLHITRKHDWSDREGDEISLSEWITYLIQDSDLAFDPVNPGPENAIFITHPDQWPLWWSSGEIYTKNPDDTVIKKMVEIARHLNAKVMGDDSEIYGTDPNDPTVPFVVSDTI